MKISAVLVLTITALVLSANAVNDRKADTEWYYRITGRFNCHGKRVKKPMKLILREFDWPGWTDDYERHVFSHGFLDLYGHQNDGVYGSPKLELSFKIPFTCGCEGTIGRDIPKEQQYINQYDAVHDPVDLGTVELSHYCD